jgi:hypothetical protein
VRRRKRIAGRIVSFRAECVDRVMRAMPKLVFGSRLRSFLSVFFLIIITITITSSSS